MSVDFRAVAAIGVALDSKKLFTTRKHKAFPHGYKESMNFCPETGKRLWYEEKVNILESDEIAAKLKSSEFDLEVLDGGNNGGYIFGVGVSTTTIECFDIPNIEKLKNDICYILEPLGLWDENLFAVYSILQVSC